MRLSLFDGMNVIRRRASTLIREGDTSPEVMAEKITQTFFRLIHALSPTHAAVCLEGEGATWRHQLFPAYKGQREAPPPELTSALPELYRRLEEAGLNTLSHQGYEADDVIGTLAAKASRANAEVVIVSTDKDFYPLLELPRIKQYHPFERIYLDATHVSQKHGVTPGQFADWLALVGDSADNIPGVAGVGPDTATKWLSEHIDLQTLISRASYIKGKRGKSLQDSIEQLRLSRELVQIKTDIELGINLKDFRCLGG